MSEYVKTGSLNSSLIADLKAGKDCNGEAWAAIEYLEEVLGHFVVNSLEARDSIEEKNLGAMGIRLENLIREAKGLETLVSVKPGLNSDRYPKF